MKYKQIYYLVFVIALGVCDLQAERCMTIEMVHINPARDTQPENGIYLIRSKHESKPDAATVGSGHLVPFSKQFLDENTAGQPAFLVIQPDSAVAIALMERPLKLRDKGGRHKLVLALAPASRSALATLTTANVGGEIAIIINGEAVTIHKIREPITEGKVQITRCTDNACEYLFTELGQ